MRIAFGIITYNSAFVLWECLESIYPFAHQILISEGCVKYFSDKGMTTSTDRTNEILDKFPDPDNKITVVHGTYTEKTDQCNAYMEYLDADYLWQIDSDEIYSKADIEKIIEFMPYHTSIGVCSRTFFGGFEHTMGGNEAVVEYKRIFKVTNGSKWANHRPPQIDNVVDDNHLSSSVLKELGIMMYHYSYVWERQVKDKVAYYKAVVSKDNCRDNYYEEIFEPWINGTPEERALLEKKYNGVHEFKPSYYGGVFTEPFKGTHPIDVNNLYINRPLEETEEEKIIEDDEPNNEETDV